MKLSVFFLTLYGVCSILHNTSRVDVIGNKTFRVDDLPKIYGVNMGGWLVLEPWITPSLFEQFPVEAGVVDQYTFCKYLGPNACRDQLTNHWNSWYSQEDINELAAGGINTLRIPVGYWLLGDIEDGEPWIDGGMYYLRRLLNWAREANLKAVIDLHCGPGSQNGFDNSGRMGQKHWDDERWINGQLRWPNIERTLRVLDSFADVFAVPGGEFEDVVIGIEILNEPRWDISLNLLKNQFYGPAYDIIHKHMRGGDFFFSDAFHFSAWWNFMPGPNFQNVYIDTHIYHVFDNYLLSLTPHQHNLQACQSDKPNIANTPSLWTVVGEWSAAFTDCTRYLNGFRIPSLSRWQGELNGAPYFGSCAGRQDTNNWSYEYKQQVRRFVEYQMDAYEASRGWFFWTSKTEDSPEWDYLQGLREGYIPKIWERSHFCDDLKDE